MVTVESLGTPADMVATVSGVHIRRALPLFLVIFIVIIEVKVVSRHMLIWSARSRHTQRHESADSETYLDLIGHQDSCFRTANFAPSRNE